MCAITTSNSIRGDWAALEVVDFLIFTCKLCRENLPQEDCSSP